MSLEDKRELLAMLEEKERREKVKSVDAFLLLNHSRAEANEFYDEIMASESIPAIRRLCLNDLFFLLTRGCKRLDIDKDWLYDRCKEVQAEPDGRLDLWARDHYKSTIITFGKSIQDILADPDNVQIGIFSHTKPIAQGFLSQIMQEFEQNQFLKKIFPDVLYQNPRSEAKKWSLDNGILVRRKTNPKEATVEAWGLVDGQPTSKHFTIQVYDDTVTVASVTSPEQIKKVTRAWEISLNLGSQNRVRRRYIGTRYHANDTYKTMMDRGSVIPRIYPATIDGKMDGEPVLLTKETLLEKRRDMGPYTFGSQMLQNPVADNSMGFSEDWLKFYSNIDFTGWNNYLLVDPASKKKETSDYTVMLVIGLAPDNNYYLIDGIRDRLNLTQRAKKLFEFHRKYNPKDVGYEEYGAQADVEHMEYEMEKQNYRFNITRLGGQLKKEDRIRMLVPVFEQKRMWLPKALSFVNYEGRSLDLVKTFIDDEYKSFPVSTHDDMFDCLARIIDPVLSAEFPKIYEKPSEEQFFGYGGGGSWMG